MLPLQVYCASGGGGWGEEMSPWFLNNNLFQNQCLTLIVIKTMRRAT